MANNNDAGAGGEGKPDWLTKIFSGFSPENLKSALSNAPAWLTSSAFFLVVVYVIGLTVYHIWKDEPFIFDGKAYIRPFKQANPGDKIPPATEFEWSKKKLNIDILMQQNSPELVAAVKKVVACYPTFGHNPGSAPVEMTTDDAEKIISENHNSQQDLFQSIKIILNTLEAWSIAYQHGLVDKEIFEATLKSSVDKWYHFLHNFISAADSSKCKCSWKPFVEVASQWSKPLEAVPAQGKIMSACLKQQEPTTEAGGNVSKPGAGSTGERTSGKGRHTKAKLTSR